METITSCRVCKGKNIKGFFDLGAQPLANSLASNLNEKENFYPLSLSFCTDCRLVQLNHTIDPEILFSEYVWVTATSKTANAHSQDFFKEISSRSPNKGYVLEIASNDGTFLIPFMQNGYDVLGVDPAENIVKMAEANGIPTKCCFFRTETARELVKEKGRANIVFARNVLPHVANTRDFVESLEICLDEDGVLGIEVHYAKKILEELHYDSIYHEHLCYFTLKSLEKLLNDFNLYIFDISKSPISGGSIVVYARRGKVKEEAVVQQYRDKESEDRTNELESWENFAKRAIDHRQKLLEVLKEANLRGMAAGYGASARSSTLLNFAGIDSNLISVIADQNPLKQGKFTAGTHIPIVTPEEMMKRNPCTVVILAWNFSDEISDALRNKFNYKGQIIIPLPNDPKIIATENIQGVKIIPLKKIPDERGVIMHGVRSDNILNDFGEVYFKKLYSGIINGWHVHEKLILNYICLQGMIKLVLYDMRKDSPTFGQIQEIFMGEDNYCLVHIPAGIANAMTVVGGNYSLICNVASEPHDPKIKYLRIAPDSGEIPYNWNKKTI